MDSQRSSVLEALRNRQQIQALRQRVEERQAEIEEELKVDPISNPNDTSTNLEKPLLEGNEEFNEVEYTDATRASTHYSKADMKNH